MKKHLLKATAALLILACLCSCGCTREIRPSEASDATVVEDKEAETVTFGTVNDNTYTNDWLDMTFSLPKRCRYLTYEEMMGDVDDNQSVIVNNAELPNKKMFRGTYGTYFDVAMYDNKNVCFFKMYFEDVVLTVTEIISAENYIGNIRDHITEYENYELAYGEITDVEIAGKIFKTLPVSVGENITVTYYVTNVDNMIVVMITTEYKYQSVDVQSFIESIKQLDVPADPE